MTANTNDICVPETIDTAQRTVRAAAYNLAMIQSHDDINISHGQIYSRARDLYNCACKALHKVDYEGASEFIENGAWDGTS